jgi:serine protease AprX
MVFFKDKEGSAYSVTSPIQFLSAKAIDRRTNQGILVNEQDIPVSQNYIDNVRNAGASILFRTRWMNGVLVQCSQSAKEQVAMLNCVKSIELVAPGAKPASATGRKKSNKDTNEDGKPLNTGQLATLGIDKMHEAGYHGEQIHIAMFDSGFEGVDVNDEFGHLFAEGRLTSDSYDFVHKSPAVFHYDDHGARAFSLLAAYKEGEFAGSAYKATYTLYVTEDDAKEYRIEEYNWLFAAERADSLGVDIISSSLGYNTFDIASMNYKKSDLNGHTAVCTRAASLAAERGILVVVSAGNEGSNSWGTITAPADAENILAVGAVNIAGEYNSLSSKGPTADGRIKPDVAALGVNVMLINSNGNLSSGSGTSFAAPLVAGLAAGVWQRHRSWSSKQLIDTLKLTASQAIMPDNFLGYGIPNFVSIENKVEWEPQEKPFEIFPNPINHNTLTIRPAKPDELNTCTIEIISAQGHQIVQKVIGFSWLNKVYETDCSGISPGIYFLRIITEKQIFTTKFVKI